LQLQQAAAIKHKTSHARLAQLLQPSLAFCFAAITLSFIVSFIASFIVVVISPLGKCCW